MGWPASTLEPGADERQTGRYVLDVPASAGHSIVGGAHMDTEGPEVSDDEYEAACRDGIRQWVADELGGRVTDIERLARWRPQWKVTYTVGDDERRVLFRGNRPIAPVSALRFEMDVMVALETNGIRVPHIYGWVEDPAAFVMDWIDTEDRAPGLLHTAMDDPTTMDPVRWEAMLSYMDHLAEVHAVPVSEFAHIRWLSKPPATASDIALHAVERMYRMGQASGDIDTPFEFIQSWLRRNVPEHRTEVSFVCGDSGQFMTDGPEVVGLLDFEIANLGDTHWDLACLRGRHPYENMGDIPALYQRYAEATGTDVDLGVVAYHTVGFLQLSAIAATFFMEPEIRGANWFEGALEWTNITRRALEAIAEIEGVELDHDLHLPEAEPDRFEARGLGKLIVDIERLPVSDGFAAWERDLLGEIPRVLLNQARWRGWWHEITTADIGEALGAEYSDLVAADAALSEAIAAGDGALDHDLIRMLHRRMLRRSMIVAGTDPDPANPFFHVLEPILGR